MKLILAIAFAVFIASCTDKKESTADVKSTSMFPYSKRMVVFYPLNDSINEMYVMAYRVTDEIVYDSVLKKKKLVTKGKFGLPIVKLQMDTLTNKPILDNSGNVIPYVSGFDYDSVKDSLVIWDVTGKDFDSLSRRKKP